MFDATRLLDQLFGGKPAGPDGTRDDGAGGVVDQVKGYARENPVIAGGIAGGLAGLLFGRGMLRTGAMGMLGGLAYKAYRDWQQNPSEAGGAAGAGDAGLLPPPAGSPFAAGGAPEARARLAETLIIAMVAAAKADGTVGAEERGRIYEKLEEGGLDAEELAFLRRAFDEPASLDSIAAGVSGKEEALEVYAAALMAIRNDTPAEREFLAALAARLDIAPGLAAVVEKTVAEATGAVSAR